MHYFSLSTCNLCRDLIQKLNSFYLIMVIENCFLLIYNFKKVFYSTDNLLSTVVETNALMDMALVPSVATADVLLGLSEKGNAGPSLKPRKKSMTSLYLKFFETSPDGKSRRCKFCKQSYSITTATGKCYLYATLFATCIYI